MFGDNKNLKDPQKDSIKDTSSLSVPYLPSWRDDSLSYTKTNKLITALYMVTDIMDNSEPIRNRLRTLGLEILSDTSTMSRTPLDIVVGKIDQIMSFLDITSTVNIISEMNCTILRKEFMKLNQNIKELRDKKMNLSGLFAGSSFPFQGKEEEKLFNSPHPNPLPVKEKEGSIPKGHTRVGVQKGSTLMKALSDKIGTEARPQVLRSSYARDFNILKEQRRNDIINIIKSINGNATIKDIKDRVRVSQGENGSLASCGEKTLQRELVSMVKDSVLNKTGEKRWSRYFLVSRG